MSSNEKSGAHWADLPPSLNHDSFEMVDLGKEQLRPHADTAPDATPYLGLRARLSQVWINRWTVLLLLVLVRVLMMTGSLHVNLVDAKTKALSACTNVEDIGSAMASMPHYLSVGVNSLAADGINAAIDAMVDVLMLLLTGVQNLILFVIDMYAGTYACLIAAFIHGSLDVGIDAVEDVTDFMNGAIKDITKTISSDVTKVQNAINSAFSAVTDAASVFGSDFSPPTINITGDLNKLQNIKVDDTDFVSDLVKLNKTIPTFDEVKNYTVEAISFPFDLIKTQLNNSRVSWTFDKSIFPVAEKQALSFCSDNSFLTEFFEKLFKLVAQAKVIFIIALAVLAVLACIPTAYLEIRRWRRQKRDAYVFTKYGYDPMDVVYIVSRPFTAVLGIRMGSRFTTKRQVLARWAVAYATSLPALFVLSLAIAGLLSCLCQYIIMRSVEKEAPALSDKVGDFAGEVVHTLQNVSTRWADDSNSVIDKYQDEINNDVLAYVVNATEAVNNTLNTFESEMNKALDAVFNGTVLEPVIKSVIYCLVGMKIESVQKGLTWVHDHAHVTFPQFPNDTFSAGAADSINGDSNLTSFLATPSTVTSDGIDSAVDSVIRLMKQTIATEAAISAALLLAWALVVLVGLVRMLVGMATPDKSRAEGGQRYLATDQLHDVGPAAAAAATTTTGTRFPRFGAGTPATSVRANCFDSGSVSDEKAAARERTDVVRGGKAGRLANPGYWRDSSHGQVEDAGKH